MLTLSAQQTIRVHQDHEFYGVREGSILEARAYWHQFPGVNEALLNLPDEGTVDVWAEGWLKLQRVR